MLLQLEVIFWVIFCSTIKSYTSRRNVCYNNIGKFTRGHCVRLLSWCFIIQSSLHAKHTDWRHYRRKGVQRTVTLYGNWKGMMTEYEWGITREIVSPVRYHDKLKWNFIVCRGHWFIHFQWLRLSLEMARFDSQLKHKRKSYRIEKDKKINYIGGLCKSFLWN